MEAGSTNTIKMEFDRFLEGVCDKAAVILEWRRKLDLCVKGQSLAQVSGLPVTVCTEPGLQVQG